MEILISILNILLFSGTDFESVIVLFHQFTIYDGTRGITKKHSEEEE